MTVKTTGAEFKRFYNDPELWPDDGSVWHEEEVVFANGKEVESYDDIPDDAEVRIEGGAMCSNEWDKDMPSFEAYFKRWKRKQGTVSFLVECDKSKLDAVKAAIKAAGGKAT